MRQNARPQDFLCSPRPQVLTAGERHLRLTPASRTAAGFRPAVDPGQVLRGSSSTSEALGRPPCLQRSWASQNQEASASIARAQGTAGSSGRMRRRMASSHRGSARSERAGDSGSDVARGLFLRGQPVLVLRPFREEGPGSGSEPAADCVVWGCGEQRARAQVFSLHPQAFLHRPSKAR